jgi:hypothetical protein
MYRHDSAIWYFSLWTDKLFSYLRITESAASVTLNITQFAYEVMEKTMNREKGMKIKARFVTSPEEDEEMTTTSARGMLHGLHDCESHVFPLSEGGLCSCYL